MATTPGSPGNDDSPVTTGDDLRIEVTNDDVRAAKRAWLASEADGLSDLRVDQLRLSYEQLIHTQAQAVAEAFRQARK